MTVTTPKSFKVTYDPSKGPVTLKVSSGYATQGTALVYRSTRPEFQNQLVAEGAVDKGDVVVQIPGEGISLADSLVTVVGRYAPGANHTQITIYHTMSQQSQLLSIEPDPNIAETVAGGASKDYKFEFEFTQGSAS